MRASKNKSWIIHTRAGRVVYDHQPNQFLWVDILRIVRAAKQPNYTEWVMSGAWTGHYFRELWSMFAVACAALARCAVARAEFFWDFRSIMWGVSSEELKKALKDAFKGVSFFSILKKFYDEMRWR